MGGIVCRMKMSLPVAAALLCASLGCQSAPEAPAPAAIRVLSSNGVKAVIEDLKPEIERAIGHPLSIEFSTATSLKAKIEQGEPVDDRQRVRADGYHGRDEGQDDPEGRG